ncbi:MAG: bifunctional [glutamate--ammonia ligase]-adenylyl-L-tyrosine phosphorylase/[glutamate--ammonia-ligase] adenylyltransferase [Dissulfurispiraceae bacterium]|jgi:glutamate-ammonia-ligase adenylyltransferase|nr:bifunctional [glutamate--ammonia ligase]-adenylyl-L-tyrosine phosphorylase/[glutamate--ammonia-ligase] adenylyltransferase [Dissulfurispiraceae bacterium]
MKTPGIQIPDPERAEKNIEYFLSLNPACAHIIDTFINEVSMLFSCSQFLANYSSSFPADLTAALNSCRQRLDQTVLAKELNQLVSECVDINQAMKAARQFRKKHMLRLTIQDLLKIFNTEEVMSDLSMLADAIISESVCFLDLQLSKRFGQPEDHSFCVLALGKLGAYELNYSSDVDLIFAFRNDGETPGIKAPGENMINKISFAEYYTKLAESLSSFLSTNTEDGFVYRVDLRLRPQGQKGSLVLPLKGYEEYYESWGQLWEKAALLRTRYVAGDQAVADDFIKIITPFIYRKYLDMEMIDEIRRLKSRVEQIRPGTLSRDIKRGYGGIREIEFFIQIFQLMYGGREKLLRERSTIRALHSIVQKGLIGYDDFSPLSEIYLYLRTLEHRLQQLNDLQKHRLPTGEHDLKILALKMGFCDAGSFLDDLSAKRSKVRSLYDSLLETPKDALQPAIEDSVMNDIYWDGDAPIEEDLREALGSFNVKDLNKAVRCLVKIRNLTYTFSTLRSRRLLEKIIPMFINEALKSPDPDSALIHLVDFAKVLSLKEAYLEAINLRPEIIPLLSFVLSGSKYLARILIGRPEYIETLVEEDSGIKSSVSMMSELEAACTGQNEGTAMRIFKKTQEIRAGMMFLKKQISVSELNRELSRTAESILALANKNNAGLYIIGMGKLGAREISFGSDLDIIFVTPDEPAPSIISAAENLMRAMMAYTKDGIAYKIDTRLRPEGNKGPLVNSIEGLRKYYMKNAHPWEIQALLKARLLTTTYTGSFTPAAEFSQLRQEVLLARGAEINPSEIKRLRIRIQKEIAYASGYDIKYGAGGLEELEFGIQYLQLANCYSHPRVLKHSTIGAINSLKKADILDDNKAKQLFFIYNFYRTVEVMLRLQESQSLQRDPSSIHGMLLQLGITGDELYKMIDNARTYVSGFWAEVTD